MTISQHINKLATATFLSLCGPTLAQTTLPPIPETSRNNDAKLKSEGDPYIVFVSWNTANTDRGRFSDSHCACAILRVKEEQKKLVAYDLHVASYQAVNRKQMAPRAVFSPVTLGRNYDSVEGLYPDFRPESKKVTFFNPIPIKEETFKLLVERINALNKETAFHALAEVSLFPKRREALNCREAVGVVTGAHIKSILTRGEQSMNDLRQQFCKNEGIDLSKPLPPGHKEAIDEHLLIKRR